MIEWHSKHIWRWMDVNAALYTHHVPAGFSIGFDIKSNLDGSNPFGTMEICSRQRQFEPQRVTISAIPGGIMEIIVGYLFGVLYYKRMLCVLIRIASSMRFLWVHTTYICKIKEENIPKLFVYRIWRKSLRTQERVRLIHSKRAIGVRAIEVLLYLIDFRLFYEGHILWFSCLIACTPNPFWKRGVL